MAVSISMNSTDIRSKIQVVATKFVDGIIAVYGEAFANAAADLTGKTPRTAKRVAKKKAAAKKAPAVTRAPKAAKKAAAPKKAAPGKRIRRSGAQLASDAQKIVKLLAANKKGLRIEQINKQLGTATKALARPILKLLEDGKIKKTGEKRGTIYLPV